MTNNPLQRLQTFGQSIWLDYMRRGLIDSGELQKLIDVDGLRGVTVNPSILEKAISRSHDYDEAIRVLALQGKNETEMYETLAIEDVQRAADLFRPLYDASDGRHGFISLEVSPYLAHDTRGTLEEARQFWKALDRPNVMIKVPSTVEGLPAIRQLTAEGINVNVTLLFGLPRYREVAAAYIEGLEEHLSQNKKLDRIASVASFFLSRIDVMVDPMLDEMMRDDGYTGDLAAHLRGQVAIASARMAYQIYKQIFEGDRFLKLADKGARSQRVLWASTSTKNPDYSDVKYVEALIGPETVNTAPQETLDAYRDHGQPSARLEDDLDQMQQVLDSLPEVGIDLDQITQRLEDEGVHKFAISYDRLMDTLRQKRKGALREPIEREVLTLSRRRDAVARRIAALTSEQFVARLWRKDLTLWKSTHRDQKAIREGLGWLHIAEKMEENAPALMMFADEIRKAGFQHVLHMGMGGSSLAPMVFAHTFEPGKRGLPLTVLDTTDPSTILSLEDELPLADTLFIVASKSGTTAETLAFADYFYAQLKEIKGADAAENFIAITDPGSPLTDLATERGFRGVFPNFVDIGGRYSALSYFGLVPAALMGLDIHEILVRAMRMMHACVSCLNEDDNPGLTLGATLGELGLQGFDKVTFLMPESISTLGMWLEQLLAESTGKEGKGLIPIAGEPIGEPDVYDEDRLFVYLHLKDEPDKNLDQAVAKLKEAGHPTISIALDDRLDIGQEFFRWEFATAVAGSILGVNVFDEPNVAESKDNTNRLLEIVREKGELPEEEPALIQGDLKLYDQEEVKDMDEALARWLSKTRRGDYIALMAYLPETPAIDDALQAIRVHLRDRLHVATTVGYGPRFLHSTGQLHKGGPNNGLFLQITADEEDVDIPSRVFSFNTLQRAQALGDLEALRKHRRRVISVDLNHATSKGLAVLQETLTSMRREVAR